MDWTGLLVAGLRGTAAAAAASVKFPLKHKVKGSGRREKKRLEEIYRYYIYLDKDLFIYYEEGLKCSNSYKCW